MKSVIINTALATITILAVGLWFIPEVIRCSDQNGFLYCTVWFKFWLLGWK